MSQDGRDRLQDNDAAVSSVAVSLNLYIMLESFLELVASFPSSAATTTTITTQNHINIIINQHINLSDSTKDYPKTI
jgi:hypothetical protein